MMRCHNLTTISLAAAFITAGGLSLCSAATYIVAGVVVDSRSKEPVANAHVSIAPTTQRAQRLNLFTKKDGHFVFTIGAPGKYQLQVSKPGYPVQIYRQADFSGLSSAIVVAEDQDTSHIIFEAFHGGAISGQIRDEDSEPVGNALVSIFQSAVVGGERKIVMRAQVRADANGIFRVANLRRGDYYVCAMGRPWFADSLIGFQQLSEAQNIPLHRDATKASQTADPADRDDNDTDDPADADFQRRPPYSVDPNSRGTAFQTTFFPRGQSMEEASALHLDTAGEAQISITLSLVKGVALKGSITAAAGAAAGNASLFKKFRDNYVLFLQSAVSKGGTFQFENVPPGIYEVAASSSSSSGTSSWNVLQEVEVNSSDTEVTLRPEALGGVSGHVSFEGEAPASNANPFVSIRSDRGTVIPIQVDQSGNFSRSRLPAGKYEILAGSREYVAAYSSEANGERLPLSLEIGSGEIVRRDVTFTRAISVIEGKAQKSGVAQVGALVLLMPTDISRRWAYRADQTDSDGSYQLATISAGDYYFLILSDGSDVVYRDSIVAAALSKVARRVHIGSGDHQTIEAEAVESATLKIPIP